jgi:hypothetical protein
MTDFLLTVFSVGDPNMKGTTRRAGQDLVLVEADGDLVTIATGCLWGLWCRM